MTVMIVLPDSGPTSLFQFHHDGAFGLVWRLGPLFGYGTGVILEIAGVRAEGDACVVTITALGVAAIPRLGLRGRPLEAACRGGHPGVLADGTGEVAGHDPSGGMP